MKIALYGFGMFNTAIGHIFDRKHEGPIMAWDINNIVLEYFNIHKKHAYHFHNYVFENLAVTDDRKELLKDADVMILGISGQYIRQNIREIKNLFTKNTTIVIVSKGLEQKSLKTLAQVVEEELEGAPFTHPIVVFSGGTTAADIISGVPLVAEVASTDKNAANQIAKLLHTQSLRVYTNNDVISVQIAGALKNIISLGAGICEGLGYQTGTKSSFITRAARDVYRIAKHLGAKDATFLPGSASFWGDIMLSSFGQTRNREYGKRLVGNDPVVVLEQMHAEHKTVEGYYTLNAVYKLSVKEKLEIPVIEELYYIVFQGKDPKMAIIDLMNRSRNSII